MSTPPPPALQLRGLRIGHRGRALADQGLDLQLRAGEILCLLGPNGCGKTTLFRTLLGLLPALGGQAELAGLDSARATRAELARRVAYVPQAHAGVFAYRVLDLVLMGRVAHIGRFSTPSRADRALALAALERLGVAHLAARPCTELSGGERQLALIARALVQQAPLLVMDEPTAALDFGHQQRVLAEIAALAADGLAVLMSTHQPEHARQVASRVALMDGGRLRAQGRPAQVLRVDALAALYALDPTLLRRSLPWAAAPLDTEDTP